MSSQDIIGSTQMEAAGSHVETTVSPDVIELDEVTEDASYGSLEGNIMLSWAPSDSSALEVFDENLSSEKSGLSDDLEAEMVHEHDATAPDEATVVADLTYYGRELAGGLSLAAVDPFGLALIPYEGGSLDPSAFELHQRAQGDVEFDYRLVVVPPTLGSAEQEATEVVPEEFDGPAVVTGPGEASALAFAFAAGVVVGVAAAGSGSVDPQHHELDTDAPDEFGGASVDELVESRRKLLG